MTKVFPFFISWCTGMTGLGMSFGLIHHNWSELFWAFCTFISIALLAPRTDTGDKEEEV